MSAQLFWPLERGHMVTSGFGPRWGSMHYGTDFGWPGGSANRPVYAVKAGTVVAAGPADGFGSWVRVDHPSSVGGGHTVYGHVLPQVRAGQQVAAGERIAYIHPVKSWSTNGDVDPHLHLEWHRYGYASPTSGGRLDPMPMLAGAGYPGEPAPAEPATRPWWPLILEQFIGPVRSETP